MASKEYHIDENLTVWLQRSKQATNKDWVGWHNKALFDAADFCSERRNLSTHYSALMDMRKDASARAWAFRWWKFWDADILPQADLWIYVLADLLYGAPSVQFRENVEGLEVKHLEMVLWEMQKAKWENRSEGLGEHSTSFYETYSESDDSFKVPDIAELFTENGCREKTLESYRKPQGVGFVPSKKLLGEYGVVRGGSKKDGEYLVVYGFSFTPDENQGRIICTHPLERPMNADHKAAWTVAVPSSFHGIPEKHAIAAESLEEASRISAQIAADLEICDLGECHVLPSMTPEEAAKTISWHCSALDPDRLYAEMNGKNLNYSIDVKHVGAELSYAGTRGNYPLSSHSSTMKECCKRIAENENSRFNSEIGLNFYWHTRPIRKGDFSYDFHMEDQLVFTYSENMLADQIEEESRDKPKSSSKYDLPGWRMEWNVFSPAREACLPTLEEDENASAEGILHVVSSFQFGFMASHNEVFGYTARTLEAEIDGETRTINFFVKEHKEPVPEQHRNKIAADVADRMLQAAQGMGFSEEYMAFLRQHRSEPKT